MPKITNKDAAKQTWFIDQCKTAGIEPTTRQASKLANGKGALLNFAKTGTTEGKKTFTPKGGKKR